MKNYVLAHDLGTTGNKATLYDVEGRLAGSAFHAYETEYAHTGWAEQNPEDWWTAVCASTRRLLQQTRVSGSDIACLSFSGQMMASAPVDQNARPLRKAIIWADQRAVDQARWLSERITPVEVYRITGHRLSASYSLCKMLWLRDHEPELYRQTHKFLHAKDTVIARLTGEFVTDQSDASGMILYDLDQQTWSSQIVNAAGIDLAQLPQIRRSIDPAGEVLPAVAEEIGVAPGTPVIIGGGDGACATAGSGVISEGSAYTYIGSSAWVALTTRKPVYDPDQKTFTFANLIPGLFMPTGTMQSAGAAYQWTRNQLCPVEAQTASALQISPYELMNLQAVKAPTGANGLLFLPYLLGERSPYWNPQARGAFVGLTIRHTRADMIRAVVEGVAMHLRLILDGFRAQGTQVEAMRLIGGGARGRFWNLTLANVLGIPVQPLAILEEATSMGAALAGGVGTGLYRDFSIIQTMNPIAETIEPDPAAQSIYEELLPVFAAAYAALTPVNDRLARFG